jgi:hypothetical protein
VLQAPVAIYISLQLLIAHISKHVHALALYAANAVTIATRPSPTGTQGLAYWVACAWSLLIYPPGCSAHGLSQERLSSNSNSALVLQAPVAIYISLQLLIAHISKHVHALALYALYLQPH